MSRSGEILRIGHGNYTFLCSQCGFNFPDITEMLAHIDDHFVAPNTSTTTYNDRKISHQFEIENLPEYVYDVKVQYSGNDSQGLSDVFLNAVAIRTEFKIDEDIRERKTDDADESPLDDKSNQQVSESVGMTPRIIRKKRSATKKPKSLLAKAPCVDLEVDIDHSHQACPICDQNFPNSVDYNRHLRDDHRMPTNKVYQCYMCGYIGKTITALKRHFNAGLHNKTNCYQCESKPAIRNESDPRPHKCFMCRTWFDNHHLFRQHFREVHREDVDRFFSKASNCNEWSCYICQKDFVRKYYLRSHMVVHQEVKAFVCDVCGKTYRTKVILKRHLNVHEGKTCECEQCGKTFPYYARLRIHRYSHRTELNCKCKVCTKAFKVQKYLARHMKVHQEEKAYACKYCEKRFTFSTGRRAHEISQHNAI